MSKIICDICGTTYQDTAECCPICGCAPDAAAELLGEELLEEEIVEEPKSKAGRFAPKKKEIFDFDEVNAEPEEEDEDEEEDYDEEEDEEEAPRHNTVVVVLLTVLIAGLLIAAGFIFFRYFLPNMKTEEVAIPQTTAQAEETTAAATEATIPCERLVMLSNGVAQLSTPGQQFLIHMQVNPENTTDKVIYTSGNESIATVTDDGKITAVSEGETTIFISCGKVSMECPVVVEYVEETEPVTTAAPETEATEAVEETQAQQETQPAQQETVPAATSAPAANYDPSIVLKLKKTDIMLGVYYYVTLQLDCDLEPTDVEWSSEHPHIAKVDEKGVVTALKAGTTDIVVKYGDQVVKCRVRCG